MTEEAEGHYFISRELAERAMCRSARDWRAAAAHMELADRYEALALVFGAKPSPLPGQTKEPSMSLATNGEQCFPGPNEDDQQEIAELEQLNAELTRSLKRCQKLLFDCRSQLAADCNMPELLDEVGEESRA